MKTLRELIAIQANPQGAKAWGQAMHEYSARLSPDTMLLVVGALEEIENRCKQVEGLNPTGIETECLRVARTALSALNGQPAKNE